MTRLRVGSLFAGIGGFDLGLERAGFQTVWQVEIDKDAISVLERHWPQVKRYQDIRDVKGRDLAAIDVLVGGWPCQDLSVAGARQGLVGSRSGLFHEVVRLAHECAASWLLLENVPGLLSSHDGRDMATVLRALADGGFGFAYRVLDAQAFGVPQRRRRVFIVGCLGDTGARAASVLFEPESLFRDLAPCGQARQGTANGAEDGAGNGGVAGTVRSHPRPGSNDVGGVAYTLRHNTNGTGASDNGWNTTYVPVSVPLTGDLSHGGTAQSAQNGLLVPVAFTGNHETQTSGALVKSACQCGCTEADNGTLIVASTLSAGGHPNSNMPGRHREDDENLVVANTLRSGHHGYDAPRGDGNDNLVVAPFHEAQITSAANGSRVAVEGRGSVPECDPRASVVQAFNWQSGGDCRLGISESVTSAGHSSQTPAIAHTLSTRSGATEDGTGRGTPLVASPGKTGIRRLMPVECERLQGLPDEHTRYRADGSEIPDGPRYRLIGNAVAVPVIEWIGRRLRAEMEAV